MIYNDSDKLFYGMTPYGGSYHLTNNCTGNIFEFDPSTNWITTLYNFGRPPFGFIDDGMYPFGNLVYNQNTHLYYGMTSSGTKKGDTLGTIFSFSPSSYSLLWNFGTGMDGRSPVKDLYYFPSNKLFYGFTEFGGTNNSGTIISFDPVNDSESVVWDFNNNSEPFGNLVPGNNGFLYGMLYGSNNIISFNPINNDVNTVWQFGQKKGDGTHSFGNLLFDNYLGLFYGMTYQGGGYDSGVIFSFNPAKDSEKVLWSFGKGKDGKYPGDSFILADAPTGINQLKVENGELKVFPNPNNGVFTIRMDNGQWTMIR